MKAVIIIELDKDHLILQANDLYDRLQGYDNKLMPLPEYKRDTIVVDGRVGDLLKAYQDGWNECLEEITGEKR